MLVCIDRNKLIHHLHDLPNSQRRHCSQDYLREGAEIDPQPVRYLCQEQKGRLASKQLLGLFHRLGSAFWKHSQPAPN